MEFESELKQTVSIFDINWFSNLYNEFTNHLFYNKREKQIEIEYNDEIGKSKILNIEFNHYAWGGVNFLSEPEQSEDTFENAENSFKFQYLKGQTKINLLEIFKKEVDIVAKKLTIEYALQFINTELSLLQKKNNNEEYNSCIKYCMNRLADEIEFEFENIIIANCALELSGDKLKFNLSKRELAVFLKILIDLNILEESDKPIKEYFYFFSKYFYFKNQKNKNLFQKADNIRKEIIDTYSRDNTEHIKVKEKLKEKLGSILHTL